MSHPYHVTNIIVYDLEVYPNWFCAGFQTPDGCYYQYLFPEGDRLNAGRLIEMKQFLDWANRDHVIAGWNSRYYDDPVLSVFMEYPEPAQAYQASYEIIQLNKPFWDFPNHINSIDLMQITPGNLGLKKIGVCLGHKKLQELPYPFDRKLNAEEQMNVAEYNKNDLDITRKVQKVLQPDLDRRSDMWHQYALDLRSKGEASIAEEILVSEAGFDKNALKEAAIANRYEDITIRPPSWWHKWSLLDAESPNVKKVISLGEEIFKTPIPIDPVTGRLSNAELSKTIYLGDRFYSLGLGGLHSIDGVGAWVPTKDQILVDIDVRGYYPNGMLTEGLAPRHWGSRFLDIFRPMVENREKAKKEGDEKTAAILKIVTNGTFGKTSDKHSALYDPWVTAHVTVTGQLGLLLQIAMLLDIGALPVSANTDGITVLADQSPKGRHRPIVDTVNRWEALTGLTMEYTPYRRLLQLDVNNYLAQTTDNKLKTKGRLTAEVDLRHTPNYPIVAKAIQNYVQHDTPIESTVYGCGDINQFILTQQVKGDWTTSWRGQPLGKMLRWYKTTSSTDPIMRHPGETAKGNEGVVANGDRSIPLDNLPDELPDDILYDWYLQQAYEWLGRMTRPKTMGLNEKAQALIEKGLIPVLMEDGKPTRARPKVGTIDFSSISDTAVMGVATGDGAYKGGGLIAWVDVGTNKTSLYETTLRYPVTTRKLIARDHGHHMIYGRSIVLCQESLVVHREQEWDNLYTESELKKARKPKAVPA